MNVKINALVLYSSLVPLRTISVRKFQKQIAMREHIKFMMNKFFLYGDRILDAYRWTQEFKSLFEDCFSIVFILDNLKQKLLKDDGSELGYRRLFLKLENKVLGFPRPKIISRRRYTIGLM